MHVAHTKLKKLSKLTLFQVEPLTDEELLIREKCEGSLYSFLEYAWPQFEGVAFTHGWHLQDLAEHLEAVERLYIRDLLINMPPRCGKSSLISVAYPVWCWLQDPSYRFVCASYKQSLSNRDSTKSRMLIQSTWFQRLWGDRFKLRRDATNKMEFHNDKFGFRAATAVHSGITGSGGEFILVDDPNNVSDEYSEAGRESTINWWCDVMPTRFGSIAQRRRVVVQQRFNTRDLSGWILSVMESEDTRWVHCSLPMEFESSRRARTVVLPSTSGKIWTDRRTVDGELLWPEQFPGEEVEYLKRVDFNNQASRIAGQLQQRPVPHGGGRIRGDWFQKWKQFEMPKFVYKLQSWDTAMFAGKGNSYTACTTWGVFKDSRGVPNVMLLSVFHEQVDYPDMRKMIKRMAKNYMDTSLKDPMPYGIKAPVDRVLIEEKATGHLLVRDFSLADIPLGRFNPGKYGDKQGRCYAVSHFIENGRVWLPTKGPNYEHLEHFAEFFIECAMLFPNASPKSSSSDIMDSMSQAFLRLRDSGLLNMREETPVPRENFKDDNQPYYWGRHEHRSN